MSASSPTAELPLRPPKPDPLPLELEVLLTGGGAKVGVFFTVAGRLVTGGGVDELNPKLEDGGGMRMLELVPLPPPPPPPPPPEEEQLGVLDESRKQVSPVGQQ